MTRRSAAQAAPSATERWTAVKEWAGTFSADTTKAQFERPQGRWRLVYKTEAGDAGKNGVADIVVRSKDNQIVTAAYNLQGGTDGVLTIKGEQSEYFLEVKSFGPRWRVAVERLE